VRVSPWELHINDADYFTTVFATTANHRTDIIPPRGLGMDGTCTYSIDVIAPRLRLTTTRFFRIYARPRYPPAKEKTS
jgi:hypothetical protein